MADQNPNPQDTSLDEPQRRALLQAAAGLAIAGAVDGAAAQETKSKPTIAGASTTSNNSATAKPEGKAGDFNFLAGEWRIDHRRLKSPGEWDEFKGEATCWTILGGVASIEELRIPARNFSGMGIRVLDIEKKIWSDFWVNSKFGVLAPPGLTGSFKDGVGTFEADDEDNGKKIRVAGIWDRITPKSCRWRQGVSRDGGKTWEYSWLMDWMKV